MALQLLQHLAPKEGPAIVRALEALNNVQDPPVPASKSRPTHSAVKSVPPEDLLSRGLSILTQYAKEDKRLRSDLKFIQDKNTKLSALAEKLRGELKRARKAAVDEFKAPDEYKERLWGHAEIQRSAFVEQFKSSNEGQAWLKDGMRTALGVARQLDK